MSLVGGQLLQVPQPPEEGGLAAAIHPCYVGVTITAAVTADCQTCIDLRQQLLVWPYFTSEYHIRYQLFLVEGYGVQIVHAG